MVTRRQLILSTIAFLALSAHGGAAKSVSRIRRVDILDYAEKLYDQRRNGLRLRVGNTLPSTIELKQLPSRFAEIIERYGYLVAKVNGNILITSDDRVVTFIAPMDEIRKRLDF